MKKSNVIFMFIVMAVFIFTACPTTVGGKAPPDEDQPEGPKVSGDFKKAPVLTFTGDIQNAEDEDDNTIQYSFTIATPDDGVVYTVYIAEGQFNKSDDIIARSDVSLTVQAGTVYTLTTKAGSWYSAVVVAERESDTAVSAVSQSMGFSMLDYEDGTGTLVSRGRSVIPGTRTFYVDYQRGNDDNSGLSPVAAWKTLTKVNNATLRPGDHILLEANSIWNGTGTDKTNYIAFAQGRGNGGILAPKGNGTAERPMLIDLYEYDSVNRIAYFSSNKRPIINGNGTPTMDSTNPYANSGAVHLEGQHYWHIRNIEVTNSYDWPAILEDPTSTLRDTHWYRRDIHKELAGVLALGTSANPQCRGILIEYCYAHDIAGLHSNNGNNTNLYISTEFGGSSSGGKASGGIIFCVTDSTVQHNIIRKVSLEGLRTNHGDSGYNNKIIGNYIERVAGDGIVMSRNKRRPGDDWNRVESNILKDVCAAVTTYGANYAGAWDYYSEDTVFQFNECYGIVYGHNDGEAWDIDIGSTRTVYQYNYSHHNAGGALLIMGTSDGIYRYNISANDGASSRYMEDLFFDGISPPPPASIPVSTTMQSYTDWANGQCIFHYTYTGSNASNTVPLIYNNTFFVGVGARNMGVFGHSTTSAVNKYVRFYNNILLKTGTGTLYLSYAQQNNGNWNGRIANPDTGFKNNLVWAYDDVSKPDIGNYARIGNGTGGLTVEQLVSRNGNQWKNPRLKIQESQAMFDILRLQRDTTFQDIASLNNNPEKLKQFTDKERIRARASLFMPIDQDAVDELRFGMVIPGARNSAIDNAWNDGFESMGGTVVDYFGQPVANTAEIPPVVGASETPFSSTSYNPEL
ncbi:MAG: hypothetical protein FWF29_05180 [Treponema sp.]|nr:hypothetical protein [Treponema sp.]